MKFYLQTRKFDEVIDYQLILSVVKYVCQIRAGRRHILMNRFLEILFFQGHILVFLPGPEEISTMNDIVLNSNE
jgi:HrpA-like RNA helicase